MKSLYENILLKCNEKKSKYYLYLISFFESIIFPIPTDVFIVPFVLADKNSFIKIGIFTTFFSVLGGCVGYLVGNFFWESISIFFLEFYPSINMKIENFLLKYTEFGIVLVIIGGISPFPYKITCLASGILGVNFFYFIFFSLISRGVRFLMVCYLLYKYERKANAFISKYTTALTIFFIFSLIILILFKNI